MSMTWEGGQAVSEKDAGGGIYSKLTITSDGWSGVPVDGTQGDPDLRKFQFDIEMTAYPVSDPTAEYYLKTLDHSYGYTRQFQETHPVIVGISLEHMGFISYGGTNPDLGENQFLGWNGINSFVGAWGGLTTDINPTLSAQYGNLNVYGYEYTRPNYSGQSLNVEFANIGTGDNYDALKLITQDIGNWPRHSETTIKTDLPIFATDADLMTYVNSGGTDTSKILNLGGEPTPEEEYDEQFKFHFIKNIYGHNTQNASSYTGYRNYRFYPVSKRMCFYRVTPTAQNPFTLELKGADGVTVKSAPVYADPLTDDDKYTTHSGSPELLYLHKSISFGTNDYYSKFRFYTDLPVYGSESQAQDYIDNIIDERSAENWNDISRAYSETFDPNYGDPDTGNDNGVNGQSYVKGARLWVMESSDLNHFFDDIFSDLNIQDILHGTQLFGASAISCIMGVMYLPIDVDDVATVNGTKDTIKLGSWACPTAKGRYVWNNNKIIDCGSFFVARVYNDFRDYEMKLSLDLPYVGTIETSIGRFLGKTLSVKYAVDITTGGCTAHIYADSLEMESYDGFMASLRPIQAIDQISHLNAVMGIIGSIGGRETGMINTATESFAGVATGSVGGNSNGGFNAPSSGVGPGGALELSAGAITDLYSLGQAVKDKPIAVRGSYAGCLGLFGCQKIHIRVQQPRIYRAPNLQQIAGFPSGVGQRVGMFSGFLSVISFQMVDGFTGTADELQEIYGILKQGIYI